MPNVFEDILSLAQDLFPKGRAFLSLPGTTRQALSAGLSKSEDRAYRDAFSVLDSVLPDGPDFTEDDAAIWERRLGLQEVPGQTLTDRKQRISDKLNYPGTSAPRQHYLRIQQELQDAGFNVFVYENNFGGITKTPQQVLGAGPTGSYFSDGTFMGSATRLSTGTIYNNIIANHIDDAIDSQFIIGPNYRSTFFISSDAIDVFADVPASRKTEFRQLILKLKPVQMVGFLFVNYI